ncbi:hypothetical protein CDL15_Pgr016874 [Punica granatum]|nr:hypothetical protein CDL15_Pgr016874 [Punica granatum]
MARVKQWKPDPKVVRAILDWLGDNGSFEDVEAYVGSLRPVVGVDRENYHALIKAGVRNGKEVRSLLERMRADGIDEDDETRQILSLGPE